MTAATAALLSAGAAQAIQFEIDYGDGISGTLNTVFTAGAAMRMSGRAGDLVGKANYDPRVCAGSNQACQGVFEEQTHPSRALAAGRGQASMNADDGNWNYDKHDLTQAVFKATQDLSLTYGDYGLFVKWLYFYDAVNSDFTEFHPNEITRENRERVAVTGADNTNAVFINGTYGVGEPRRVKRRNGRVLEQIGTDLQLYDAYFYGSVPFYGNSDLTFKVGRQTVNWGESTVLLINSVNQVNAINVNNFTRVGFDLSELFTPSGMVFLSVEPFENTTLEGFYGYEWEPVEIPAPGTYFSFADVGTNNAVDHAAIQFGGAAEDPEICPTGDPAEGAYYNPESGCGTPLNNPLSGLTNTSLTIRRVDDREPQDTGQYGLSLKYFAEWLNNGTELGFYFMNYHSKFPYVSFYSTLPSCARAEGNPLGLDATNGIELLAACPDLPFTHPDNPDPATSNAVPIDTVGFQFEYPENLKLYGFSFNTTLGDWSIQGELAYRPDSPLQVDLEDLTFHALGPMLSRCHDPSGPCTGSNPGFGIDETGAQTLYQSSDFTPYPGRDAYPDTFDLGIGHAVGSARSFPSFVGSYRGVAPGETPTVNINDRDMPLNRSNPRYIQGWQNFDVYQLNIGSTYIQSATENWFGADQVIWVVEGGAQFVPDLPDTSELQIEAFGTFYHASAGADGSMTGNFAQDCAHTADCDFGGFNPRTGETFGDPADFGDGLRFNPHQQDASGYADDFSFGYAIVNITRYESVFPGVSFEPFTIWQHDVKGTSVDVANQFIESAKQAIFLFQIRYKESIQFVPGYVWFTGGGRYHPWRDRDQALFYVKYQF